jgi:hypothetical protein
MFICSGSIKPDTNLGDIITASEVFNEEKRREENDEIIHPSSNVKLRAWLSIKAIPIARHANPWI